MKITISLDLLPTTKTASKIVGVSRYKQRACLQAINSQSFNFTVNGYTEINFCLCHSLSFKLETTISSVPSWGHCFTKPKRENLSSLCYCFALLAVPKETPDFFRRTNQGHCRKKKKKNTHTHTHTNENFLGRKVKFTEKKKSKKTFTLLEPFILPQFNGLVIQRFFPQGLMLCCVTTVTPFIL